MASRKSKSRKASRRDSRGEQRSDNGSDFACEDEIDQDLGIDSPRRPRLRLIASLLIVLHLLAIVLPPLALQTSGEYGPSPLIGLLFRPFEGYCQFFHLDRGYAFFAPDPGPSHLIQAAIIEKDGQVSEQFFPDRQQQWPRLLYHRHFMLAEFLNEIYFPPGPPNELFETDRLEAEIWQQGRGRYEFVRQSMVDHLSRANEGKPVQIRRVEHGLPSLEDYRAEPIELTDHRLYQVLLDQPIYSDSIAPAPSGNNDLDPAQTEVIPAPDVQDSPNVKSSEETEAHLSDSAEDKTTESQSAGIASDDQAIDSSDQEEESQE